MACATSFRELLVDRIAANAWGTQHIFLVHRESDVNQQSKLKARRCLLKMLCTLLSRPVFVYREHMISTNSQNSRPVFVCAKRGASQRAKLEAKLMCSENTIRTAITAPRRRSPCLCVSSTWRAQALEAHGETSYIQNTTYANK